MMFVTPDSLIPDPYNPLDWNRYLYARANPIRYNDPSGHVVACDKDDWACQTHWDYPIYVDNDEYTFDTGLTERQVEFLNNVMEIGLPIVFEPIDWMMTYDACVLKDDCSPLILLGLVPVIPSSLGAKVDDIIKLLPMPKRANWPWHHLLPQQFRDQFLALGVKVDDFLVSLPKGLHEKIHEGAMGGAWNKAWGKWLEENQGATPLDIYQQISVMIHDFGLDGFITIISKRK